MYFETANARDQFTQHDFQFIVDTLTKNETEAESLHQLMFSSDELDSILDDPALVERLESGDEVSNVSSRFFLYLTMRKTLKQVGVEDRDTADYLANMLARFAEHERWRKIPNGEVVDVIDYEYDISIALQAANQYRRYEIHAYGGDRNLFMTGLHARFIRNRSNRYGAPGVGYYENAGRGHYRIARDHPVAKEFDLSDTFDALSNNFQKIRSRLNYLAEEYFA